MQILDKMFLWGNELLIDIKHNDCTHIVLSVDLEITKFHSWSFFGPLYFYSEVVWNVYIWHLMMFFRILHLQNYQIEKLKIQLNT